MKGATGQAAPVIPPEYVSIHAPVKGATFVRLRECEIDGVSIHAPVKGATAGAFSLTAAIG